MHVCVREESEKRNIHQGHSLSLGLQINLPSRAPLLGDHAARGGGGGMGTYCYQTVQHVTQTQDLLNV